MKRDLIVDIIFRVLLTALFAFFIGGLIFALCSCKPKQQIVERYVTDTVYQAKADTLIVLSERTDSVVVRDSVFTLVKGDTVLIREYHYRDRTNQAASDTYKASADTVWKTRTVTEYKTVTVEVERRLHWWQSLLMALGAVGIVLLLLRIAAKIAPLLRKQ